MYICTTICKLEEQAPIVDEFSTTTTASGTYSGNHN